MDLNYILVGCPWTKWEWIVNKISYIQLLYLWLVDNTVIGRQNIPHNRSIFFFGFEFRPHSIIPVTWNQYNIYSHTSSTYRSVEGHHWLINWVTKTHPPSTPVENCNPNTVTQIRICLPRNRMSWNDVIIIPSLLFSLARFCSSPEVKFHVFGRLKHGEEKSLSKKFFCFPYQNTV